MARPCCSQSFFLGLIYVFLLVTNRLNILHILLLALGEFFLSLSDYQLVHFYLKGGMLRCPVIYYRLDSLESCGRSTTGGKFHYRWITPIGGIPLEKGLGLHQSI